MNGCEERKRRMPANGETRYASSRNIKDVKSLRKGLF